MSKYDEVMKRFEEKTLPLHAQHREEVKQTFKLDGETPYEEREDKYMNKVYPRYERQWTKAAQDFVAETVELQRNLEERAYGKPSPEHVIGLSTVPNDKLEEVLSTAKAAGDTKMQESVIAVARQRGERSLVNSFVEGDATRKAAVDELGHIPEHTRLEAIANGRKVPKADAVSLAPDYEAMQKQASKDAADEAARAEFFKRPRRMVGRKSERV